MSGGPKRSRGKPVFALVGLLTVGVGPMIATALEIDWFTLDGGGGTSSAGFLSVRGTIAQPDALPLSGGSLVLRGGFWSAPGLTATDAPILPGGALPVRHRLSAGSPNPSRWRSTLEFDLPRRERARIRVYDVAGRLVNTLVDAELEPGSHEVVWDGRDRSGRRVASGVYLVRMSTGSFGATRKLMRLH